MRVKWNKKNRVLLLDCKGTIDASLYNVIRRSLMSDYPVPAFTSVTVDGRGVLPVGMIVDRIQSLPVTEVGRYTLDAESGSVTSDQLKGPGTVEPGVLLTEVLSGDRLKVTAEAELQTGRENLKAITFMLRGSGPYLIEPLTDLYGERECRTALRYCLQKIKEQTDQLVTANNL